MDIFSRLLAWEGATYLIDKAKMVLVVPQTISSKSAQGIKYTFTYVACQTKPGFWGIKLILTHIILCVHRSIVSRQCHASIGLHVSPVGRKHFVVFL